MSKIHERLEEIRNRENLSRRSCAREVEARTGYSVSHSSVGQYENGTTVPSAYAAAICEAFGVNPRWLLTGEGLREDASVPAIERALAKIAQALEEVTGTRDLRSG